MSALAWKKGKSTEARTEARNGSGLAAGAASDINMRHPLYEGGNGGNDHWLKLWENQSSLTPLMVGMAVWYRYRNKSPAQNAYSMLHT